MSKNFTPGQAVYYYMYRKDIEDAVAYKARIVKPSPKEGNNRWIITVNGKRLQRSIHEDNLDPLVITFNKRKKVSDRV